jgi:hypothetical protein
LLITRPELLTNRWLPTTVAFTHLLTLGVGALVMLGALFQVMPVVSNQAIPGGHIIAPWARWSIVAGTLALSAGFLTPASWLHGLAAIFLVVGFGLFIGAFGTALVKARPAGDTTIALRLAALSLVATLALGVMQLSVHLSPEAALYHPQQTQLHAFVGGFGWVMLLVMGVSFQVIPMFHVAPAFSRWVRRHLVLVIFAANALVLLAGDPVAAIALFLTLLATILYAVEALRVLGGRKRKLVDYTVRFWQLGLSNLIAAALLALSLAFIDSDAWRLQAEILLGLIFGLGFALSVILGMLQKIIPFLIYMHLQRLTFANVKAMTMKLPPMNQLIPTASSRWQFRVHLALLCCIYIAPWAREFAVAAGLLLVAAFGWLGYCLWQAWRRYLKLESEISRLVAG